MLSIDSFIHRRTVILNQETPASIAAKAMRENEIGCVLVTDGAGRLVGIVTDRDFTCRWAADSPAAEAPISRIMTPEIVKADENAGLHDVITLMENHGIRRIPIVASGPQGQERVLGIVTLDDLIASGSIAPSHLAQIVRRQMGKNLAPLLRFPRTARTEHRSEAHMHQTLDRFYSHLSKITGLSPELTPQVTQFLLEALLARVTASAAAHFVAQLPKLIQEPLLRLPSGPDRRITCEYVIAELISRYRFSEDFARSVLAHFIAGLENLVDAGQIRQLRTQLPHELQVLFPAS